MDQHTAPNERQQYGEKFRSHTGVEKKRWRKLLDARFPDVITGVLSCYDRLMLQGTLPNICFAGGMEQYLRRCGIAYKDHTQWASPLADRIENRAAALAVAEGIQIEFWRKKVRKEDRVQQLLAQRGGRPGPICILSAMEKCDTYRLCKKEKGWGLRPDSGKCLHYYSISWIRSGDWDSSACPPGLLFACNSTGLPHELHARGPDPQP
jgi:hypothetical protein